MPGKSKSKRGENFKSGNNPRTTSLVAVGNSEVRATKTETERKRKIVEIAKTLTPAEVCAQCCLWCGQISKNGVKKKSLLTDFHRAFKKLKPGVSLSTTIYLHATCKSEFDRLRTWTYQCHFCNQRKKGEEKAVFIEDFDLAAHFSCFLYLKGEIVLKGRKPKRLEICQDLAADTSAESDECASSEIAPTLDKYDVFMSTIEILEVNTILKKKELRLAVALNLKRIILSQNFNRSLDRMVQRSIIKCDRGFY